MAVVKTLLHEFVMGDVEDVEIYAAEPIWRWQQTEAGKWCMENCIPDSIVWMTSIDHHTMGHRIVIQGEMTAENYTYWQLKYQ